MSMAMQCCGFLSMAALTAMTLWGKFRYPLAAYDDFMGHAFCMTVVVMKKPEDKFRALCIVHSHDDCMGIYERQVVALIEYTKHHHRIVEKREG